MNFANEIPTEYLTPVYENGGMLDNIEYPSKAYFGDGSETKKPAFVYLPPGYDAQKKYNVLFLMHGIGGNEREWGMCDDDSKVKAIMDNLILKGEIEPFIVVAPNGRSSAEFAKIDGDFRAFYSFGDELRNDLIPYIDEHYATYSDYDEAGYDKAASRNHRAMAGLSMGGMQTINIGISDSLDLISWFAAFSAAPTSYTAMETARHIDRQEGYDVDYYYSLCGTEDSIAYNSAKASVNGITKYTDKLRDGDNFTYQEIPGDHDFAVWYLGFYNFARIVFK